VSGLHHSQSDVLRWLLISLGIGTDPTTEGSWPIHASSEPDSPDDLITVYDTTGVTSGRIQRTGETVEHRGITIQVRGTDHQTAWAKADALRVALDESISTSPVTIGGYSYVVYAVTVKSGPLSLGTEPNTNRFLFTINAVMSLRQIT
jgi:hypothetical protein